MTDIDIRNIISNYMSTTFSRGASRFIHTKRDNLLENTVDISDYRENIQFSNDLYDLTGLYTMKSLSDIQFVFQNEYLIDAIFSLKEKEQYVIYYKYFLCMRDVEIAMVMHITRQTVTRIKLSALRKLRTSLEESRGMWR